MRTVIITGGAGFIGSTLADLLLKEKWKVIVIDNFDPFYDKNIKLKNIKSALENKNFRLIEADIRDVDTISKSINCQVDTIIHLAAKAGVRYSIFNPTNCQEINVSGTMKVCELAEKLKVGKIIFSSSSSVYGDNQDMPWTENANLYPKSPYAETKVLSEKYLFDFANKTGINTIIFRFFSVYGPRMRPDLMMSKIAKSIYQNQSIEIFGDGNSKRDYTYIDDIVNCIVKALNYDNANFDIFNIGNGNPIKLNDILTIFEKKSNKKISCTKASKITEESNTTWANIEKIKSKLDFVPQTNISEGIDKFLKWSKDEYSIL